MREFGVDHFREHVEVGLHQRGELAEALDLRHDRVLGADRLQHAGVGREAGLAAALAREAELLEQDLPQLLGGGDQELRPGELEDLGFQLGELGPHALGDRPQALDVEAHPEQLHVAQDGHQRQLDLLHHALQAALGDLLALPVGQRPEHQRAARERVLERAPQAALLGQLLERVAAPGRLEQVGPQQRVVHEPGRDQPERLRVVGRDGPLAALRHELLAAVAFAEQDLAVVGHREAPRPALGEQLPVGGLALGGQHRQLGVLRAGAARSATLPSRTRAVRVDLGRGGGRGDVGIARAPPRGGAAGRAARSGGRTRARGARSGSRAASAARSTSTSMSRWTVARRLDRRASSACSSRFCLRLGPLMSSMCDEHPLERAVRADQLAGGLLADARDPGDVVGGVPLEPVEVGDQLRRDAVAVDHRLAVVHLRLGDPPRGGHHLDQPLLVDQLQGVAVAGHDHHRDGRLRAGGAGRQRGDHVVGLVALDAHVAVAEGLHQRFHRRPLLLEQVRAASGAGPCTRRTPPSGPEVPASHTTSVGHTPYSVTILTSIEANPKIALVGSPVEVAIDSGSAKKAR